MSGTPTPEGEKKDPNKMEVEVKVNRNEEIEDLKKRLESERKAKEEAEKKAKELEEAKGTIEEEKEDLKAKLETIAEAEFNKRKAALVEKVKSAIPDPTRAKEVEDSIQTPEDLKRVEFMLTQLDTARQAMLAETEKVKKEAESKAKEAEEATKKVADLEKKLETTPAPSGTAPLNPSTGGETPKKGYESYMAMIKDLRAREAAGDPEAKAALDAMFRKWVEMVKKDFNASIRATIPKERKTFKEELENK